MERHKFTKITALIGLLGITVVVAVYTLALPAPTFNGKPKANPTTSISPSSPPESARKDSPQAQAKSIEQLGMELLNNLREGKGRSHIAQGIQRLKREVHDTEPTEAASALISLLQLEHNAPTGMEFDVGEEGTMRTSATWRGVLLDLLGQSDPEQSAIFSQSLLGITNSQEEYALCLRNIGWANFDGNLDDTLRSGVRNMLARNEWVQAPEPALLEALDAATATMMSREMADLIKDPSTPYLVRRGAFIALDRMMLQSPVETAQQLLTSPSKLEILPLQRASLLSRLDPRDPQQIKLLQTYLLQEISPEELDYFIGIFPHTSSFDSHRLITGWDSSTSLLHTEERLVAARELARQWLASDTFSPVAPQLRVLFTRLGEF